jgi:hypothetical protein
MTPKEAWIGRTPPIDHFHIFGCIADEHVPHAQRKKIEDKGEKCFFSWDH